MGKKERILGLDAYLKRGGVTIFKIYAAVSCIGYVIDSIIFYKHFKVNLIINIISVGITLIVLLLYRKKKLNLKISFATIIYLAFFGIVVYTFYNAQLPDRLNFFLRDSLFVIFILTLAALIVGKIHAIIIMCIQVALSISMTIILDNHFLQDSIYLIVLFFTAYALVVYFFVSVIEKAITEREVKSRIIEKQNNTVWETNRLLEERQQQIEEQSVELKRQTKILKFQSEQMAVQNDELDQLNKTKDRFLSILAHDLKTPFNLMLGYAELLKLRYTEYSEEKKLKYIGVLVNTARKTYTLFENLLQWTRSQSNTIEFKPKRISLFHLLKQNLYFYNENLETKHIEIIEEFEQDCYVVADSNMMDTVLRNLISNAIKFTPEGGCIQISCKKNNNMTLVEIVDNGSGIEPQRLKNLFKIDKMETSQGTSGETGTGLGLILCKDFIEKNGGKIWVESKPGTGSKFAFSLPSAF